MTSWRSRADSSTTRQFAARLGAGPRRHAAPKGGESEMCQMNRETGKPIVNCGSCKCANSGVAHIPTTVFDSNGNWWSECLTCSRRL
jgi:hypothetical protein